MPRRMTRAARRAMGLVVATVLFVAAFLPFSCIRRPPDGTHAPSGAVRPSLEQVAARPVRVLLVDTQPAATIGTTATYSIWPVRPGAILTEGRRHSMPETVVRPFARGLYLGDRRLAHAAIRITTERDGALVVNGRSYRGEILVRRVGDEAISIVNVVPIESYLYSVLGSETYASWPAAALEAQAIVARTYTLWRMADRKGQAFDLYGSVRDQSYEGVAKEDQRLTEAVDRTAGVVLLYQTKLFRSYYHSTCGDHTEAVENYFPAPALLPLSGAPCGYCAGSKHYRWQREILKSDLGAALRRDGVALRGLTKVEVVTRTKAGRARDVAVEGEGGERQTLSAAKLRVAVGPRRLPSTFFELYDRGRSIDFRGRGWGHGVGLCQWGAKGMADAGRSAREILRHYYAGATLARLYHAASP